ncbi:MAG: enterochelin esterase [Isosphaeraceae bacterium]|nr:enterochelin esterase [Isosphaeraceae bacterium]
MPRLLRFLLVILACAVAPEESKGSGFEVVYDAQVHPGPISTRVYVMLSPADGLREPRFGPNWFQPQPFYAVDAKDWRPGEPLAIGAEAIGFPKPLAELKPGKYAAQAVVRLNPDTHALGDGEGNAYGPVLTVELGPEAEEVLRLTVDKLVPPKEFRETDRIKRVEIPSPLLSAFYQRPIRHRAAVILPEGDLSRKRPTLYIIPGFGGDHHMAPLLLRGGRFGFAEEMIRVVLDPDCGTGHHVFADSATNGPRGRALIEELIPYIEAHFPALAEPGARLLNGHSSGGWSALWLQISYPEVFGGTWSTSPDPVDFRDFQRINLYAPGANMFRDRDGNRRPIARCGKTPVLFYEDFSRMEDVIGDGGQLRSFEAVFSPLGPDGRARRLWDRQTGTIDPEVAKAWEAYDIRLILEHNWPRLGPKLAGKLHVYTGELDTFYLEGAVKRLKESLQALGSDAVIEIFPGKDHGSILDAALAARLDREMKEAVQKDRDEGR